MNKICFKCGESKPLHDFYKHSSMKDGYLNRCKKCHCKQVEISRKKNIDHYNELKKVYMQTEAYKECQRKANRKYNKTEASKLAKSRWDKNNRTKRKAIGSVTRAVRDGKLVKPPCCEKCGISDIRLHGHHDDYAKPMIVRWLCPKCHKEWHKENGEGLNGTD